MKIIVFLASLSCFIASAEIKAQPPTFINGESLPSYVLAELEKIAQESGEHKISISSKKRSVEKQVSVMLDYYIECTKASLNSKQKGCGIERAKRVYHLDCHGGFSDYDQSASREENVRRMTKALIESLKILGEKRTCMNHVEVPGIKSQLIAVDIRPSSINDHQKFYEAVKANSNVIGFYYPYIKGKPRSLIYDDAFHLEFRRQ